ncbi:PLD nuclease N-terminal domain-containing protein [Streptomyces sp. WMMC897]|uniref:PLD nuclease N-terminal domain-containing protein n=1 Tax=Streptomyces sp. WMMC897 TaxID=3014782 RepID=UPI003FCEDA29
MAYDALGRAEPRAGHMLWGLPTMLRTLPFLLMLAVWIYAFVECLNTPEQEVRKLPKVAWVLIILLFVPLGPIAWFIAGRPRRNAPYGAVRSDERRWVAPDDNPNFLKSLDERDGEQGRGQEREHRDGEHQDRERERRLRRDADDEPPASDAGPEDPPPSR